MLEPAPLRHAEPPRLAARTAGARGTLHATPTLSPAVYILSRGLPWPSQLACSASHCCWLLLQQRLLPPLALLLVLQQR